MNKATDKQLNQIANSIVFDLDSTARNAKRSLAYKLFPDSAVKLDKILNFHDEFVKSNNKEKFTLPE